MLKSVVMLLFCILLLGCNRFPGHELWSAASDLKIRHRYWLEKGRPENFNLAEYGLPVGTNLSYFIYTNSVSAGGKLYHCRFGAKATSWPRGVLAITDEGQTLWVRESDGKVTLSPEKHGIDP